MKRVALPSDLEALWRILEEEPEARVYAGGTDLLVWLRAGKGERFVPVLVCLERIEEIRGVREEGRTLWLGAATTHAGLLESPPVRERLPVLACALSALGSPLIRAMGTLGGNLCTASPAGDALPPLHVLEAEVEIRSRREARRLPIAAFIAGPGQTDLRPGEIVTAVRVPVPEGSPRHHFEKVGLRRSLACSVASLAALLWISPSGVVDAARLAWGSVGPTVLRIPEAEAALVGGPLTPESLRRAAEIARRAVAPIDDIRASAAYRRLVSGNLLLRLLPGGGG